MQKCRLLIIDVLTTGMQIKYLITLENSEHVSYERLICWQEMISKTQEGQSLTQNELEYLHEIVRIAFYNHRLNNVSISDVKNHDTGKKSGRVESQNYSLL